MAYKMTDIDLRRLEAMPEEVNATECARWCGVYNNAVYYWMKTSPRIRVPYRYDYRTGHNMIKKEDLIKFLIDSGKAR